MGTYLLSPIKAARTSWAETKHLMLPLRVALVLISLSSLFIACGQVISHKFRWRIGDKSKRAACCGSRPDSFESKAIQELPELAGIVKNRGRVAGYARYFDCEICGQGWVESINPEERGKGLITDVKKI